MFPFSHLRTSTLPTYLQPSSIGTPSYALVTGATDGVGLGFAHELLSAGFNVILHGRNTTKLQNVQSTLQETYPTRKIHILRADASKFTQDDIDRLVREIMSIKDMNLAILVNNVGGASPAKANFQTFEMHTPEEINALVSLNILFTVQLTHALLPILQAGLTHPDQTATSSSKAKKALILNIGSQASIGIPYISVYGGTKGFLHTWSRCLAIESQPFAATSSNPPPTLEVLEILIGSVQTQQNQIAKPTFWVPDARTMAGAALARVGCGERNGVAAYWPHALQQTFMSWIPGWVLERVLVGALKGVVGKEERVW